MNFYKRKQKWKYALFLVAILISSLSIYLISDLENSLEKSINSLSQSIETLKNNEKAFVENEKAFVENEKAFVENEKAFVENEETFKKNEETFKRNEETFKKNIEILNNNKRILEQNIITLKKEEEENIRIFGKALEHLNNMDPDIEGDYSFSMEILTGNIDIPLIHVDERGYMCDQKNIIIPQSIKENTEDSIKFLEKELNIMKKIGDSVIIDVAGDKQKLYYRTSTILKQTRSMNEQASIMEEQTSIMNKETERIRDETRKMQEGTKKMQEGTKNMQDRTNEMQDRTNSMQEKTRNSQEFTNKIKKDTNDILNEMKLYPLYYTVAFLMFIILAYLIFNAARRSEQNQVWAGMAKETAHQIGTPLSSLMAWVELLKQNPENESMAVEMDKDLKRLETITERFSKIGSKSELHDEDITEIIEDSISYMGKRFSKNIQFVQNISIESKKIKLNKVLLVWVIENICKNAADAMKGEGEITINCIESDEKMHISISDTGSGIDKSIIKSIFMPGITSKKRGWGLGLSLSKRIIEDYHKGKIFVKASNEKDGTTFCINLPKS
jgi:nitrogen-specific signal transduction histidine kinase